MSTLEDLLRRIEDAIDATSDRVFAGQSTVTRTTRDTGPAVVRAVLEATLPDVDVCPDCRGIGHRVLDGERSASWCRPCNGIGYVNGQPRCWLCTHPVMSHIRTCHVCGCLAHYPRAPLPAPPPPVVL